MKGCVNAGGDMLAGAGARPRCGCGRRASPPWTGQRFPNRSSRPRASAPAHPDAVRVGTVSGIPAGKPRSDGTMAYLSLPARDPDKRLRLRHLPENPTGAGNFERPSRTVNY